VGHLVRLHTVGQWSFSPLALYPLDLVLTASAGRGSPGAPPHRRAVVVLPSRAVSSRPASLSRPSSGFCSLLRGSVQQPVSAHSRGAVHSGRIGQSLLCVESLTGVQTLTPRAHPRLPPRSPGPAAPLHLCSPDRPQRRSPRCTTPLLPPALREERCVGRAARYVLVVSGPSAKHTPISLSHSSIPPHTQRVRNRSG
jgi:hypothetical protein